MIKTQISGVEFHSSIEFSQPLKAGLDAYLLTYPKNVNPEEEKMSITLVFLSAIAQKQMGMNDAELLRYVKTTFFAVSASGKPITKSILNKDIVGELLEKKIPTPSILEVFLLPLNNSDKIIIGFNYTLPFTGDAQKIISEIAASLKETK